GQGRDESEVIGGCGIGGVRGLGPRRVLGGQGGESLPVLGEPCVLAAAQLAGQGREGGTGRPPRGRDGRDGLGSRGRRTRGAAVGVAPSGRPRAAQRGAGIAAFARPVSVTVRSAMAESPDPASASSTAPRATRLSIACRLLPAGRGSGSMLSSPPHTASASTAEVRSEDVTSAGECSGLPAP